MARNSVRSREPQAVLPSWPHYALERSELLDRAIEAHAARINKPFESTSKLYIGNI